MNLNKPLNLKIAEAIMKFRFSKKISQKELAESVKISSVQISKLEKGRVDHLSPDKIAEILSMIGFTGLDVWIIQNVIPPEVEKLLISQSSDTQKDIYSIILSKLGFLDRILEPKETLRRKS